MQELVACTAALGIGLSLGLIGAGGSILTIPVFVYVLKIDPLSSSIYSMFVVGISSLAGGIQSIINKLVDWNTTVLFGIPSIAGVFIARRFLFPAIPAHLLSIGSFVVSKEIVFMLCLASLMLFAATRMLRPMTKRGDDAMPAKPAIALLLLRGVLAGIITGLLGVGGGFLIVPALHFWASLPVKKSIGTALIIICSNCFFGFCNSYSSLPIDWIMLIKFSAIAIAGILIGTRLSARIQSIHLKKIFGWFILCTSFYIIYKTILPIGRQFYS